MELEEIYDDQESIPDGFGDLYKEVDGKFVFSGVKGVMGAAGQKKLKDEAGRYRIQLKEAKQTVDAWSALGKTPEEVQELLDKYPELEAAAAGKAGDEDAITKRVEARLAVDKAKIERERDTAIGQRDKLQAQVNMFEESAKITAIREEVINQVTEFKGGKFRKEALEDILMYAERHLEVASERDDETGMLVLGDITSRDKVGVTPHNAATAWLAEMVERKPHWLEASEGGGAGGSSRTRGNAGANPWSHGGWSLKAQGEFIQQHGMEKAQQMAKMVGSSVGGLKPPPPAGSEQNGGRPIRLDGRHRGTHRHLG